MDLVEDGGQEDRGRRDIQACIGDFLARGLPVAAGWRS